MSCAAAARARRRGAGVSDTPLTPKQQRFIAEYLIDLNATRAYIRAGYSVKGARVSASRLLANANVAAAVAAGQAVHIERAGIKKARVLEEYRRIAFLDPRGFWEKVQIVAVPGGPVVTIVRLRSITDLDAEHAAALAGFEAVIKGVAGGDGVTDLVYKIKFWDKLEALNALAQHLGLLKNQMEVTGMEELFARLDAGRARNAARKKP
jgi:phage terminase small subunit